MIQLPRPSQTLGFVLIAIMAFGGASNAADAPRKMNIVLILADDLGYGDLGCYGATEIQTPNIDRLASEGVRSTAAYGPAATCTPSRYSLMTGGYAWRQPPKKTNILDGDAPLNIDPGCVTLPSLLRQAGYRTALVGKWHLGLGDGSKPLDFNGEIKPGPLEVGFDEAFFIPATVDRVPCVFIEGHRVANLNANDPIRISYRDKIGDEPTGIERPDLLKQPADRQHSGTIINGISRIGYMAGGTSARWNDESIADVLTARSLRFIESNCDRPFFLYLGLHDPHVPRLPAERFRGTSGAGVRGDTIHQIDWVVGEIAKKLDELNIATNTLLIVTSDNGPILFDGYADGASESAADHAPAGELRGAKYQAYEGGTRVPFIARLPGRLTPRVSDEIFSMTDMLATCAAVAGKNPPAGAAPDSLNLWPMLLGEPDAPKRKVVVQQGINNAIAIRKGDWKFIAPNAERATSGTGRGANAADDRFSAAMVRDPMLFNLAEDPGEMRNLAEKNPEKVAELRAELESIRAIAK